MAFKCGWYVFSLASIHLVDDKHSIAPLTPKLILRCLLLPLFLYSYTILPGRKSWPLSGVSVNYQAFLSIMIKPLLGQHSCMHYMYTHTSTSRTFWVANNTYGSSMFLRTEFESEFCGVYNDIWSQEGHSVTCITTLHVCESPIQTSGLK